MVISEDRWREGDQLESLERLMLQCAADGEKLDAIDGSQLQGTANVSSAIIGNAVRAVVLRYLLTRDDWPIDPKGVQLRGLRISGLLDLQAVRVRCSLWLDECVLDDPRPLALDFAEIPQLTLTSCRLSGISANTLKVGSNLSLQSSILTGPVNLSGASIGSGLICTSAEFSDPVVLSGIRIGGAMMFGAARVGANAKGDSLICNGMNLRLSAHLWELASQGAVVLDRADIGGELNCRRAQLGANKAGCSLAAEATTVRGAMHFEDGFRAAGAIWLNGASIGGQVRCDAAHIGADDNDNSLICDGMRTGGSVNLDAAVSAAFTADGAVRLAGAQITGSLSCRNAKLGANRGGNSLVADEIKVSVAVLLDRLDATGGIRLAGAEIAGQLSCRGAQITGADHDGNSLIATRTRIGGPAYLNNGFLSAGAVDLSGADVGGVVNLAGATLGSNKSRCALVGDGMRASRDVVADNGNFSGGIRLTGAVVDGSFICRDTKLNASMEHYTLAVARLKVGGDVILDRLDSAGALLMAGADIGGRFCCRGSSLKGADPDGDALSANSLKVGGSVLLTAQFTAAGAVQLSHSTIGGSLRCSSAQLKVAEGERALTAQQINVTGAVLLDEGFVAAGSVSLRAASIARELRWEPGQPARGEVNLEGARTQQLTDNWASPRSLGYWPATRLRIAGFTYDRFGGDQAASVEQRLAWIRSQFAVHTEYAQAASPAVSTGQTPATSGPAPVFVTQPYKQLADVYRRAGQEDEARSVEIAMRRDLRTYGNLPKPARLLNWVLDVTIRYGFQTARALAGLAVLYIVVFVALLFAQHQGTLIEASNLQNTSLHPTALQCVTGYPSFYPPGYAFDLVVPLVNIHQADFWQVNGHHWLGWMWVLGSWTATALGWFLATLLVVGYSGLARQQ